jgi:hypothetical protein
MKLALFTAVLALSVAPGFAVAKHDGDPPHGKGAANGKGPNYTPGNPTPGPKAGLPAKAKAYGRYCKGESKKHVKGEKGTPFSRCVTAMAKASKHEKMNPSRACRGLSKKHVKGEKGIEFSRCVKAAAKLRRDNDV